MTEFEKWLAMLYLKSADDCCNCAFCPPDTFCDNEGADGKPDDNVCMEGLKKYFEEHKNDE